MTPPHPLVGMALVGAALGAMMLLLRTLRRRAHPELLRKLLHVGMGLVSLSFPWLFNSPWPVAVLGVLASVLMLLVRRAPAVRARLGGVVDGVKRETLGEVWYPVGVAALFALSQGDAIAFSVPLLTLALGDAVAALVGVRYGLMHFTTDDGNKSWEGSAAFFLVAFLSVHVPLLLFSDTGRAESLIIGLILALLVMLLEAMSWRGLDNLFIPLGGFLLLQSFRQLAVGPLLVCLLVALLLVVFALAWRGRTTLNDGAVLGAALIGYVAWAVGGWRWLIPPLTLFSLYAVLFPCRTVLRHDTRDVLQATAVGLLWLLAASAAGAPFALLPYTVSFAAHLAMFGAATMGSGAVVPVASGVTAPARTLSIAEIVARSLLTLMGPFVLLEMLYPTFPKPVLWIALLLTPVGVLIALAGERLAGIGNPCEHPEQDIYAGGRIWLRLAGVLIGSALPLAALLAGGYRP